MSTLSRHFRTVDQMGVAILRGSRHFGTVDQMEVEVLRVDVMGVDIMAQPHCNCKRSYLSRL